MSLRFYGKGTDGTSQSGSCPSVSVDEDTGDLIFVGYPVYDPDVIADIQQYSHIDPGEQAFRVPKQLRKATWEACGGNDPDFD